VEYIARNLRSINVSAEIKPSTGIKTESKSQKKVESDKNAKKEKA